MTGTERKVFQKYYPPDFDPRKIPKAKQNKFAWIQRVMTPFNMTCNTCGEYVYKGKKFNMRREPVEGAGYLGLKLFRFYFRCPNCLAEIVFRTDLENCDYQAEHGCTRLFEAHKFLIEEQKKVEEQEEQDRTNPMKMLEKRTKMSRKELEQISVLEEIREQNKAKGSTQLQEQVLADYAHAMADELRRQEEEDEAEIRRLFGKADPDDWVSNSSDMIIKRIKDESDSDSGDDTKDPIRLAARVAAAQSNIATPSAFEHEDVKPAIGLAQGDRRDGDGDAAGPSSSAGLAVAKAAAKPTLVLKRKAPDTDAAPDRPVDQRSLLLGAVVVKKNKQQQSAALSSLAGAYGSASSSSDNSETECDVKAPV